MVRSPEYEEMDRARSDAVPRAFEEVFGRDSGYSLKEDKPDNSGPPRCGPIQRNTYHIYRRFKLAATIYQNGHIEIFDESIRDRLAKVSEILERAAAEAYEQVTRHSG